jgi:AraC-like DNA-binding protein
MAISQSRIRSLVGRAVNCLERDRSQACQYLKDAYTLLGEASAAATRASCPVLSPQHGGLATWQARRAMEYIEAHLGEKMTAEDIAAVIGLSKSHFSRAFKSSLASPPMAYVAARRVERAKQMIVSGAETLAEVALACGFADQSHLNRQFRRVTGVTPGQWRRSSIRAPGTASAAAGDTFVQ